MRQAALAWCAFGAWSVATARETLYSDYNHFVTEPDIRAYRVSVIEQPEDSSILQPGYIFYSPFPREGDIEIGPHIIDQEGELVWWGNGSVSERAQNFHVCEYKGVKGTHLCWDDHSWTELGHVHAQHHIMDDSYQYVGRDYGPTGGLRFSNPHEFQMTPGGDSFLHTVYQLRPMDLRPYGGLEEGYVEDGCFQDVDIETGNATFTWCSLDHIPIWHTWIFLPGNIVNDTGESYGSGTKEAPWDFSHMNSVDKNAEGDYFISIRHQNYILKIAGNNNLHGVAPGTVLWRLGGKGNEFLDGELADISRPHHVRHVRTTATETVFTVFNNHFQARQGDRRISNGQIIVLNNETKSLTSTQKFYNPEGWFSLAMGSMQALANGNMLIGWGTTPQFSEFSKDGKLLYHAHVDQYDRSLTNELANMQNYRIQKFDWVAHPTTDPKVVSYSRRCGRLEAPAPLVAYASWNGATSVKHWRFSTSGGSKEGPWKSAGTYKRTGFETKATLSEAGFARFVKIEALDKNKQLLGMAVSETFVPPEDTFYNVCDEHGCQALEWFNYVDHTGRASKCPTTIGGHGSNTLFVSVVVVGCLAFTAKKFSGKWRSF